MHKCACTTRALERFILDFAGVSLRQQRLPPVPRNGLVRRGLATSARRRNGIEAVQTGEAFIPFATQEASGPQGRSLEGSVKGGDEKIKAPVSGKGGALHDDDWHAEIEITNADAARDLAAVGAGAEHVNEAVKEFASPETENVEDRGLLSSAARVQRNRLARKQRRIAAGTYKPSAALRASENTEESRTANVLDMIDGMETPDVAEGADTAETSDLIRKDSVTRKARAGEKPGESVRASRKTAAKEPPAPMRRKKEPWQVQKAALTAKFGDATWSPRKRLSPDTLEGIRTLHSSDPNTYNTATLSQQFAVSPENIRRILRSKWQPNEAEREDRAERWERRGVRKWTAMAEGGERPPKKWREMGVGSIKGEPEAKPAWKKGGVRSRPRSEDVPFESMEDVAVATLNARIL